MSWTTPAELRAQVIKLWDKGLLLACWVQAEGPCGPMFPLRLAFKGPTSSELSEQFPKVQAWIAELRAARHIRVQWREVKHRVIGGNRIPEEIWLDTMDDALALIGKQADAQRFQEMVALTRARQASVLPWLARYPHQALQLREDWPRLLDVTRWMRTHPRPAIYLRQIDLPGIHSKFVEAHRAVLSALLDLALPAQAIEAQHSGTSRFASRYGFLDEPLRIRFRILDPALALLPGGTDQDFTLRHDSFAALSIGARRVFITENKTNFLAFPRSVGGLVIFGEGYGFETLAQATWLRLCEIQYWGDLDTHGFAILSQLRAHLPHAQSLLMDSETLMAHRPQWGSEPTPERRDLPLLTAEESGLFDDLRDNRFGVSVRLEQERIGFQWVKARLATLQ